MKVWTEIAAERLAGNFRALSGILGEGTALLAVVKANAYGHGIDPCAGILAGAGAEWLGVTDAHEGARVRVALAAVGIAEGERQGEGPGLKPLANAEGDRGLRPAATPEEASLRSIRMVDTRDSIEREARQPEILVMSGTVGLEGEAECIVRNGLTAVVWEPSHVERLAEAKTQLSESKHGAPDCSPVRVHLEVDTGMSRQGVAPGARLDAVLRAIAAEPRVALDGVFTHFASTEVSGSEQTAAQQREFEGALAQVASAGLRPRWVHVGNSSYIDNSGDGVESLTWLRNVAGRLGARPMVRSGLALYGYLLPIEGLGRSVAAAGVSPVMTWKTRVIGVREVSAGARVGYNGAFFAERPMRLALLPLGYADGLRRELSSCNTKTGSAKAGGWVMIGGQRAAIVGRVSMNLTTVDVSGIAGVAEGNEVVVIGEGVSADDHARLAGTIAYEILCGVRTSG